jgi:hypothetical protein
MARYPGCRPCADDGDGGELPEAVLDYVSLTLLASAFAWAHHDAAPGRGRSHSRPVSSATRRGSATSCDTRFPGHRGLFDINPHNIADRMASRARMPSGLSSGRSSWCDAVTMLLKVDFDSGITRRRLFADYSARGEPIILMNRIQWVKGETSSTSSGDHIWAIWSWKHKGPPTIACGARVGNRGVLWKTGPERRRRSTSKSKSAASRRPFFCCVIRNLH